MVSAPTYSDIFDAAVLECALCSISHNSGNQQFCSTGYVLDTKGAANARSLDADSTFNSHAPLMNLLHSTSYEVVLGTNLSIHG